MQILNRTRYFLFLLASSLLLGMTASVSAGDADAKARLEALLSNIDTLQADFTQTVLDEELLPVQESSGRFLLNRGAGAAGKFRWDYTTPFQQTIVADGTNVWTYDPDLEQATVKGMSTALASSPAAVLTGSEPLDENFTVKEIGEAGPLYWVELHPHVQDTDFEVLRLALDGEVLDTMELKDALGQTTRIRFSDVTTNAAIDADAFVFELPEGADLIGEPQVD
ncbi:MAG: outer membrane lipoprotein chaperone LolA [Gammaproteobacteria bacterium]|nr:outer membrane lipoprotein chaperone LolA [Gammaproteobacteria bacterium]